MAEAIKQRAHELIAALPDDATWQIWCTHWSFEATWRLRSPMGTRGASLTLKICDGNTADADEGHVDRSGADTACGNSRLHWSRFQAARARRGRAHSR
jgi:hypothetical protein